MPKVFRRKFSRRFSGRRGSKRNAVTAFRFSKARRTVGSTPFSNVDKEHTLKFAASFVTKNPLPDRYFCWVPINLPGSFSSGATNYSFAFAIDSVITPFNYVGGSSNKVPNPQATIANYSPLAVRNLLYTAGTGTGLWKGYRVWRSKVTINFMPQSNADASMVCMAPIANATQTYSSVVAISNGSNSSRCLVGAGASTSGFSNSIQGNYSIPALQGIPKQLFSSGAYSSTYASTGLTFVQVGYTTMDGATLTNPLVFEIQMMQLVEFFGRQEVGLDQ